MQQALFCIGLIAIVLGLSVLWFFGIRKLHREYQKQKLMRNNPVVEIADLKIKAPILEGTMIHFQKQQVTLSEQENSVKVITALLVIAVHYIKSTSTILKI